MVPPALNLTVLGDMLGRRKLFRCPQCSDDLDKPDLDYSGRLSHLFPQDNLTLLGRKICWRCALCWDFVLYQRTYSGTKYRVLGLMAFNLESQRTTYSLPLGGHVDSDVDPPRFCALELAEMYFRLRGEGMSGSIADDMIELTLVAQEQCLTLAEVRALLAAPGDASWKTITHLTSCPRCRQCVCEVEALGACPTQLEMIRCRKRILTRAEEQAMFRHIFQGPGCPRCKQIWASLSLK